MSDATYSSDIDDVQEVVLDQPGPSQPRKRSVNKKAWKKVSCKKLRDSGEQYISHFTGNVVPARNIGPPCHFGHLDEITIHVIKVVFKNFWELGSYDKQTAYLHSC